MKHRLLILIGLLAALVAGAAEPFVDAASAHPLDLLMQDMRVRVQPASLAIDVRLIAGPLVTPRLWEDLDRDRSGALDEDETAAWCRQFLLQLPARLDQTALAWALDRVEQMPTTREAFIGAASIEIAWSGSAPLPAGIAPGDHELALASTAYPDISAVDWSKTRGRNGIVVREAPAAAGQRAGAEMRFPIVWPAAFSGVVEEPTEAAAPTDGGRSGANDTLIARLRAADPSIGLLLGTLGLAFGFGALHALQPGHGKTLVAAYLVGSRGTVGQAVLLGGIVTFTHTASVFMLGGLLLAFSAWIDPQRIIPGLTVVSGGLVALIGCRLLLRRIRLLRSGGLLHDHGDGRLHDHGPGSDHRHAAGETGASRGSLISLGVSGGLVPCPEALAIMIVAATIGRLGLGLAMIVAFSLGLAGVLIGIGVALVVFGRRIIRRPQTGDQGASQPAGLVVRWLPVLSALLVIGLGTLLAAQGLGVRLAFGG